ncbi:MAG: hypothetical protein IJ790_04335 [Lachnospiraceae bacterium]|nr:hypothetical protein [Lachnospiraceae bacterium]
MSNIIIGTGIAGIIVYLILRIIHEGLHEFKQIFFLNSKNILLAVVLADIYVVFDILCIKAISGADVVVSCVVVVIATTISYTSAMIYQQKHLKEYIYKFEISTKYDDKKEELERYFKDNNIPYKRFWYFFENNKEDEQGETKYHEFDIYAFTKEHSKRITKMLDKYDRADVKYVKINTSNYKEN